jgi:hypothetical protein
MIIVTPLSAELGGVLGYEMEAAGCAKELLATIPTQAVTQTIALESPSDLNSPTVFLS